MIFLLFTSVSIISTRAKNCNRTKWTARRSTIAPSDCQTRMIDGSNSIIITRNECHSSSTPGMRSTQDGAQQGRRVVVFVLTA